MSVNVAPFPWDAGASSLTDRNLQTTDMVIHWHIHTSKWMHPTNVLTVGMGGHTPSPDSQFTAACPGPLLAPAQIQPHISHIPQSPQASGGVSQLGVMQGCSLIPWCNVQKPHYKQLKMEHILLSPLHWHFKLFRGRNCPALPPNATFSVCIVRLDWSRMLISYLHFSL